VRLLLAIAVVALGACASAAPHGEFYGKNLSLSSPDMHDLAVVWVDGQLVFDTSVKPVVVGANVTQELEPGRHELRVRAIAPGEPALIPIALTVEPCTRYTFAAKDTSRGLTAVAMGKAPIPGCRR
jgi:hypothetical protein